MQLWKFIWAWWAHRSRSASSSSVLHFRMSSWCLFSHRFLIFFNMLKHFEILLCSRGRVRLHHRRSRSSTLGGSGQHGGGIAPVLPHLIATVSFLLIKSLYLQMIRIVWVALLAERRSDPHMVLELEVGWFCFQQWCRRLRSRRRK